MIGKISALCLHSICLIIIKKRNRNEWGWICKCGFAYENISLFKLLSSKSPQSMSIKVKWFALYQFIIPGQMCEATRNEWNQKTLFEDLSK